MFRAGKAVKQVLSVRSVASSAKQARVQPTQSSSSMTWGVVAAGLKKLKFNLKFNNFENP